MTSDGNFLWYGLQIAAGVFGIYVLLYIFLDFIGVLEDWNRISNTISAALATPDTEAATQAQEELPDLFNRTPTNEEKVKYIGLWGGISQSRAFFGCLMCVLIGYLLGVIS